MARVTTVGFVFVASLIAAAAVAALAVAIRWATSRDARTRRIQLFTAAGAVLLVLGIRLVIMRDNASWSPFLDQYEGELATVIGPFRGGTLQWTDFAAAHNDHRILTTRLATLACFVVNREWDNRVLAVANYVLLGLCAGWFLMLALREHRGAGAWLLTAFVLLPSALIIDWENLVTGFQIQFLFIIFPSLLALAIIPSAPIGGLASVAGFAAALFATLSMASGLITPCVAMVGIGLRAWTDRTVSARTVAAFALLGLVAAQAWLTRPVFPAHAIFHAHSPREFLAAFLAYGAWPFPPNGWLLLLLWLPWAALVATVIRARRASPFDRFLVCLGLWLLGQVAALAWGRAGFASLVSARYAGMLEWTPIVALASLHALVAKHAANARPRRIAAIPVFLAAAILAAVLIWRSHATYRPYLSWFTGLTHEHEAQLKEFLRTDDPAVFNRVEFPHSPYPVTDRLVSLLRDPAVRDALPAPLRREHFRGRDSDAFGRVHAGPLTALARTAFQNGRAVVIAGALLLACAACFAVRGFAAGARTFPHNSRWWSEGVRFRRPRSAAR